VGGVQDCENERGVISVLCGGEYGYVVDGAEGVVFGVTRRECDGVGLIETEVNQAARRSHATTRPTTTSCVLHGRVSCY
jgi:hypothetical protein